MVILATYKRAIICDRNNSEHNSNPLDAEEASI
jgi:hypothetical protein